MSDSIQQIRYERFRATLAASPEAVKELSDDSILRYARGQFPKALLWLIRHPALLSALAEDAQQQKEAA